jgi:hypothetical protein
VLAACQPDSSPAPSTAIPVAPGQATVVEGCTPEDLDNWSEQASYLVAGFADLLDAASVVPPEALDPILEDMYTYRLAVDGLVVPEDCALETHSLINLMITDALDELTQYRDNPDIDVEPMFARAQYSITLIHQHLGDLLADMEATYEAERAE